MRKPLLFVVVASAVLAATGAPAQEERKTPYWASISAGDGSGTGRSGR